MINIFSSAHDLCSHAMELFIKLAAQQIKSNGRFTVALAGGSTPNRLYNMLAMPANAQRVDWKNVFVFWGDERYVGFDNEANNSFQAKEHLLSKVPLPAANIFRIPVNSNPQKDAKAYEQTLLQFFGTKLPSFDLIFLGMGDEGHTASIFPQSELLLPTAELVKDVYVAVKQMQRISFTPALLNAAREVIFMITGAEKAPALKEVLEGSFDPQLYPAQIIKPSMGNLHWLMDECAAALLTNKADNKAD